MTYAEARAILNADVNTSHREILLKLKILSCKYHPDKYALDLFNDFYAKHMEKFEMIVNARDLLVR